MLANRYLLPGQSIGSPMSTETARRWLRDLGEHADVRIAGGHPLPKMGRRTWYRLYRQQRPNIEAGTAAVTASQGSRHASVSEQNYLTSVPVGRPVRTQCVTLMQGELADIFDEYL